MLPVRYATKDATRRHKLTAHDRTATAIPLSHLLKRQAYLYPGGVASQHQNTSQSKPSPISDHSKSTDLQKRQ
jgi:hypothetical protein